MAGDISMTHRAAFKDLLTICQLRGRDSTGVVKVGSNNKVQSIKRIGTPDMVLETKFYDKEIDTHDAKVLLGHCRAKTFGEVSVANAHPFEHGDVIGVHNGTLRGHHRLEKYADFDVDSDLLYWHINEYGPEEAIKSLDPAGAWALVWWNHKSKTLNFIRNKERPLWFTYSKDMKTMFWASEPWWFGAISRKCELWDGGETGKVYFPLETDKLFSYEISRTGAKPSDVFTLKAVKEVEARGNSGNVTTTGPGSYGNRFGRMFEGRWQTHHEIDRILEGRKSAFQSGGSVTNPFSAKESAKTFKELLDRMEDGETLNDIATMGRPPVVAPHKPSLPSRVNTQTAEESSTTKPSSQESANSSQTVLDLPTDRKNTNGTARTKLSLVSNNSSHYPQERKESTSNESSGSCVTSQSRLPSIPKTSVRELAGLSFITDHKTGKEYEESFFDQISEGCCSFCRQPVGDLSEVAEIFADPDVATNEEDDIRFICKSCVADPFESFVKAVN